MEKGSVTTKIEHETEIIDGKEYPLTITKQTGFQEIQIDGKLVAVEAVTIFDSPLGRSICYTAMTPKGSPEERAANRKAIQAAGTQAILAAGRRKPST